MPFFVWTVKLPSWLTRRVGWETAYLAREKGTSVAIIARNLERAHETEAIVKTTGQHTVGFIADVSDPTRSASKMEGECLVS